MDVGTILMDLDEDSLKIILQEYLDRLSQKKGVFEVDSIQMMTEDCNNVIATVFLHPPLDLEACVDTQSIRVG